MVTAPFAARLAFEDWLRAVEEVAEKTNKHLGSDEIVAFDIPKLLLLKLSTTFYAF